MARKRGKFAGFFEHPASQGKRPKIDHPAKGSHPWVQDRLAGKGAVNPSVLQQRQYRLRDLVSYGLHKAETPRKRFKRSLGKRK